MAEQKPGPLKWAQYAIEYAALRFGVALVRLTPLVIGRVLVTVVADLACIFAPRRRRISIENILACGVRSDRRSAARLARASFRHFGIALLETVKFQSLLKRDRWKDHVEVICPEEVRKEIESKRGGMIVACGHFGNSELAGYVLSRLRPLIGIARRLDNPWVDRYTLRIRFTGNFVAIPKHDANMFRLLDALKQGAALAVMIDQHAGTRGMVVDFMGRPASTHTAIALLALTTRLPMCFGTCRRVGPMRYQCRVVGPIPCERTGDKKKDVRNILMHLNDELAAAIREAPEQYLWAHRRWRPEDVARAQAEV